jgi:hypothetical protein
MNALSQLSRSEKITGVAGILLLIGILAFPWYHVGFQSVTIEGHTIGVGASYNGTALQGPGAFAGVLALLVLIALFAELIIRRFTTAQLPQLPVSWGAAELYAAIAVLVLLAIKILTHIGNFGWGFYADMLLAIVLVYGAAGLVRSPAYRAQAGAQPQGQ